MFGKFARASADTRAGAADQEDGHGEAPPGRKRAWVYVPYRVLITLALFIVLLQPVLAGQFMSGEYGALLWHQNAAAVLDMVLIASVVAGVLIKWPGRGPFWPILAPLGMLVLTYTQNELGFSRLVALHVPLGVLIILVMLPLTIWTWQPLRSRDRTGRRTGSGARS